MIFNNQEKNIFLRKEKPEAIKDYGLEIKVIFCSWPYLYNHISQR